MKTYVILRLTPISAALDAPIQDTQSRALLSEGVEDAHYDGAWHPPLERGDGRKVAAHRGRNAKLEGWRNEEGAAERRPELRGDWVTTPPMPFPPLSGIAVVDLEVLLDKSHRKLLPKTGATRSPCARTSFAVLVLEASATKQLGLVTAMASG